MNDTERCIDRDWIYNYCRLFENYFSRTYKDGWVEMWKWEDTYVQTGTDKLNNNVQIQTEVRQKDMQTGICKKQLAGGKQKLQGHMMQEQFESIFEEDGQRLEEITEVMKLSNNVQIGTGKFRHIQM